MELTVELPDPEATEALGGAIATAIAGGGERRALLLLSGELGAGKTSLARGFLRSLGVTGAVPSPTYTLVEPYETEALTVNHLDLYRLADVEELEFLGFRELTAGVVLVEWPERAPGIEAGADLVIALAPSNSGRTARLSALSDGAEAWLERCRSELNGTLK